MATRKNKAASATKEAKDQAAEEQKKALGQTDDQIALKEYHKGEFQTTDPVTGEARGKLHRDAQQPEADEE